MSKKDKLLARLCSVPADFTWDELAALLSLLGFEQLTGRKTGGSRRRFYRPSDGRLILCHKPHPGSILGRATLRDILQTLKEGGDLD